MTGSHAALLVLIIPSALVTISTSSDLVLVTGEGQPSEIFQKAISMMEDFEWTIKSAVELRARYINDRKLPDKAIDVIDEVGAAQMLVPESRRKKTIGVKDVESVVAKIARIPPKQVTRDDRETLKTLESDRH